MDNKVTFIWNDVSVVPDDIEQPVLYLTVNGKMGVLKNTKTYICPDFEHPVSDWKNIARKYHITLWVYQSYLTGEEN